MNDLAEEMSFLVAYPAQTQTANAWLPWPPGRLSSRCCFGWPRPSRTGFIERHAYRGTKPRLEGYHDTTHQLMTPRASAELLLLKPDTFGL
jgi:hypothetical protein